MSSSIFSKYIAAGFSLVPIPAGSKNPNHTGWNDQNNCISNIFDINRVTENVGLAHAYSTPITCTIDIDHMELAKEWLEERGVDLTELLDHPDAVLILSGRENRSKLLYRLPESLGPLATKQIKHDQDTVLEFRCAAKNGKTVQDVLPPSIHPETGRPYEWGGKGNYSNLPTLPPQIVEIWLDQSSHYDEPGPVQVGDRHTSLKGLQECAEQITRVREALSKIPADCPRDQWMQIIFAVRSLDWNCGKELAEDWSKTGLIKWDKAEFEKLWASAKADGGINIGTLFYYAENEAGDSSNRLKKTAVKDDIAEGKSLRFDFSQGLITLDKSPPAPREYLFANAVVPGTLCILAGLGGTAKTTLMMQIAMHAAIGEPIGDLQVSSFASILFLGEESVDERNRRFGGLASKLGEEQRRAIEKYVLCYPAAGKDIRLTISASNNIFSSDFADHVLEIAEEHKNRCGKRIGLILFDHARLVMTGDPNAAVDVTQLTRVLTDIAVKTGAAVVLLAHSPKTSYGKEESSDAAEIFGSTAFADNARAAFVLCRMRDKEAKDFGIGEEAQKKYVSLTNVKANYSEFGAVWWFKKEQISEWQVISLSNERLYKQVDFPQYSELSKKIMAEINSRPGRTTERSLKTLASAKTEPFYASEKEVKRTLDRLIEEGLVVKSPVNEEVRKKFNLSHNIKEVLTVV